MCSFKLQIPYVRIHMYASRELAHSLAGPRLTHASLPIISKAYVTYVHTVCLSFLPLSRIRYSLHSPHSLYSVTPILNALRAWALHILLKVHHCNRLHHTPPDDYMVPAVYYRHLFEGSQKCWSQSHTKVQALLQLVVIMALCSYIAVAAVPATPVRRSRGEAVWGLILGPAVP